MLKKVKFSAKGSISKSGMPTSIPRGRKVVKNSYTKPSPKSRVLRPS